MPITRLAAFALICLGEDEEEDGGGGEGEGGRWGLGRLQFTDTWLSSDARAEVM